MSEAEGSRAASWSTGDVPGDDPGPRPSGSPASVEGEATEAGPQMWISALGEEDLSLLRARFFSVSGFEVSLPGLGDRVSAPSSGRLGVYEEMLRVGLRFPLHPFVTRLLWTYSLVPAQLVPNSWRLVIGFLALCLLHGLPTSVDLFRHCYMLKKHPKNPGWWYFCGRGGHKFFKGMPSSIHAWKERYVLVRSEQAWGFDPTWRLPDMAANKPPKLSSEDEGARQSLISLGVHNIQEILAEGTLISAGLISVGLISAEPTSEPPRGKMGRASAHLAKIKEHQSGVSRGAKKEGDASSRAEKKKRMASSIDAIRAKKARMEAEEGGGTALAVTPLQTRAPAEPIIAQPAPPRGRREALRGIAAVSREPSPALPPISHTSASAQGIAAGTSVGVGSDLIAETTAGPSREEFGYVRSAGASTSEGSVFKSADYCLGLIRQSRSEEDHHLLEGMQRQELFGRSYLSALQLAYVMDEVWRSYSKLELERDDLRKQVSSLDEQGMKKRLRSAEEKARVADEKLHLAEEKLFEAEAASRGLEEEVSREKHNVVLIEAALRAKGMELREASDEVEKLEEQLQNSKMELRSTNGRADKLQGQLNAAQAEIGTLRDLLRSSEEEVARVKKETSELAVEDYFEGFRLCKKQVTSKYPELDLSFLDEADVEVESEPETREGQPEEGAEKGDSESPSRVAGTSELGDPAPNFILIPSSPAAESGPAIPAPAQDLPEVP